MVVVVVDVVDDDGSRVRHVNSCCYFCVLRTQKIENLKFYTINFPSIKLMLNLMDDFSADVTKVHKTPII